MLRSIISGRLKRKYLVKWKGFREKTCGDEDNLNCGALLSEYGIKKAHKRRLEAAQKADEDGGQI